MRVLVATVIVLTSGLALAQEGPAHLTLYKTVSSAACEGDQTIWADPRTHTYYVRGEPLYGKTSPGGYNCRKQAEAAGYHPAKPR